MKLALEIKDGTLKFDYEVGSSKHSSTTPVSADNLISFTDILKHCSQAIRKENEDWKWEVMVKAATQVKND